VTETATHFEEQYLALREKEHRLYSDEQVALLPEIDPSHPLSKEWEIRKRSSRQLMQWLISKQKRLDILEIGCGNGWLSAQLAKNVGNKVTGIDVNETELLQAKRVFDGINNLEFQNCEIESLAGQKFDVIIFSASIQYFGDLSKIISTALDLLQPKGELHILDTHFYKRSELEHAKKRSIDYFNSVGFPGMSEYYFHHSIDELKNFNYKIIHNPNFIIHQLMKNKNPFYWIVVQHA